MRTAIKWWLFPGFNLNARLRWRTLPEQFGEPRNGEVRDVLDAGCGNGMLSYQSYLKGNRVTGVSIKQQEVTRCRELFNTYHGISEDRLSFHYYNLYEIEKMGKTFDEIICTEVMEHIENDTQVCRSFWNILKPGGVLHLCCPNADHPLHKAEVLDEDEEGGHVRAGYTLETYRALLEPIGFRIDRHIGLGGPLRSNWNKRIIAAERKAGLPAGFATFAISQPFLPFDESNPRTPYSIYVRAVKDA